MSTTRSARLLQPRKDRCRVLVALVASLLPLTLNAQQPTPQQQSAIRQSCRGDFQANCAGVPTGGSDALQCLKNNFDKATPGCQKALGPLMSNVPASAPSSGIGSSTPDKSSASAPVKSSPPAAGGPGGATRSAQPAMREELMLTREVCGPEFRSYCANVQLGGGRAMQCLEANSAQLSPRCKGALAEIRARR